MNLLEALGHFWISTASAIVGATLIILPITKDSSQPVTIDSSLQRVQQESFWAEGSYEYLGQQVSYSVIIPKKGGKIAGEVKGACNGSVLGDYTLGKVPEIKGAVESKCKVAFITQNASAKFSGRMDQGEKKAYLDWVGDGFIAGKRGSVILELYAF